MDGVELSERTDALCSHCRTNTFDVTPV